MAHSELDKADDLLDRAKALFFDIKDGDISVICAKTLQHQLREIESWVVACRKELDTE